MARKRVMAMTKNTLRKLTSMAASLDLPGKQAGCVVDGHGETDA